MRQILPVLACALATPVLMATPLRAADCSAAMIAPAPGETLSVTALDANNACLTYLHQRSAAADLSAQIADSDRRAKGEKPTNKQATAPSPPPPAIAASEPPPAHVLPQTDSLYIDQHGASATLVFADSSTAEVTTGTGLPDGLKVTAINRTGVYVRNADGQTIRLNDATSGFQAQPVRTAVPSHQLSMTHSPFGALPGMP
ncbi:type IV pilus biogenesis protein PilP [Acetobacter papayae]|uniref:type IV pilus biogenesis protein PilP n=1 Tax=Acetobacter papayae TaxID=1076592 RepID=UPI000471E4B3|nr:type IV pilus biogenesis protein PilP [Acetobacter papayae]